jgi:hypothetical protein
MQEDLEKLEKMYLDLIQPKKLIEHFETDEDFIEWLRIGSPEEMGWALKAFETAELYRYCKLIKDEIESSMKQ